MVSSVFFIKSHREDYWTSFLQVEELIDEKDGAEKYESFVNSYGKPDK